MYATIAAHAQDESTRGVFCLGAQSGAVMYRTSLGKDWKEWLGFNKEREHTPN